ncbi:MULTISPECIES: DUF4214 domain-containing protein [unclassified Pseudomonas]|uniref:DUF4214 domain-containing protein n=1 Tax=unclassified Pseudomonas TaxID=196821 RepID=UPI00257B1B82|nr:MULTISPECIES: DUF4214 domain-containing protein [unclassified Pseudomonas]
MTTPSSDNQNQSIDIGFVDTYENGHFSGWYYSNRKDYRSEIELKINTHAIKTIKTNVHREDVAKQLGVDQASCGFNFVLDLANLPSDGCTISFHEPASGKPLNNGFFKYDSGKIMRVESIQKCPTMLGIKAYVEILQSAQSDMSAASFVKFACIKLRPYPDTSFVALSYMLILGRTPDPIGFLNSLHPDLSTDAGRNSFILTMVSSAEFKTKRTLSTAVADLNKLT